MSKATHPLKHCDGANCCLCFKFLELGQSLNRDEMLSFERESHKDEFDCEKDL